MSRFSRIWLVTLLVGCATTDMTVTRGNRPYPAYPATCSLTFDYADLQSRQKLLADHVDVAGIEFAHPREGFRWTKALEDKVRAAACGAGGNVVLYAGSRHLDTGFAGTDYAQLEVYRKN